MICIKIIKKEYLKELLQESDSKLTQRNKLIKIADSSEALWETVRRYKAYPLASNSEDENKIFKVESRAVQKRMNALKTKFPRPASSTVTKGAFVHGVMPFNSTSPRPSLKVTNQHAILCIPLNLHVQQDHGFFLPLQDPPHGPEDILPVETSPIYVENVHATWQKLDNQDQCSQHCQPPPPLPPFPPPPPRQGNEELKDKYSPSKNDNNIYTACELTTDYYEYEQNQTDIMVKGRLRQNIT